MRYKFKTTNQYQGNGYNLASKLDSLRRFCVWSLELGALSAGLFVFSSSGAPAPNNQLQTNSIVLSSNRFLLILETSRSMENRANGTLHAIQQLLVSGMGGQMQTGDSLGIWTYNNQLYTGHFPLQYWSPETQKSTVQNALAFLQAQKCEKIGNLSLIFPTLEKVVKNSQLLTVILVNDGEDKIHGTGFDEQINKLYNQWKVQQAKAKMPLITILRSVAGRWTNFSVNASPWPVEMPPMPKLPEVAKVERKQPPPKPAPLISTNNLIISGRKIAEARAAASNTLPISRAEVTSLTNSSPVSPTTTQAGPAQNQADGKENAGSTVGTANLVGRLPQPPSSQPPVSSSAPDVAPSLAAPTQLARSPAPIAPSTEPAPGPKPASSTPVPVETAPSPKQPPVADTSPIQPGPVEQKGISKSSDEAASRKEVSSALAVRQSSPIRSNSSASTVGTVQHSSFKVGSKWMVTAIILLAGIISVILVGMHRARSTRDASLITRSLDRKEN